ncbi:MAG: Ig-like domain-containing protein [Deltaproteobacteria bacterium]|nr:Ig-like domain-containing protein [Deltaproteobacteria bacterium]
MPANLGTGVSFNAADATPPTVVSRAPTGARVSTAAAITVKLDEAIAPASVVANASFTITPPVAGTLTVTGDTITMVPAELIGDTTYTVSITTDVTDLAGNALAAPETWSFSTATFVPTGCTRVGDAWQNELYAPHSGTFYVKFDAMPAAVGIDGVVGASFGPAAADKGLAVVARFNASGTIDVRDRDVYTADSAIAYTAGTMYHFKLKVDLFAHRYNVYVRPEGGSERTVGTGLAFPRAFDGLLELNNLGMHASTGALDVCDVTVVPAPTGAKLLFQTRYEGSTNPVDTVLSDIYGTDESVGPPNAWAKLNGFGFAVNYVCGSDADRWARIVDDPTRPDNRVLAFWLRDTEYDESNSRVEADFLEGRPEARFQRVRMYLHPDMLKLIGSGLQGDWFMFQEFWIRPNWTGEPNSFRISFNLARGGRDGSERFQWMVDANECCANISGQETTEFWKVVNKDVPVPIGEWFTAETYYRMGDADHGRVTFSIQRDGGPKQTVVDVTNWTYHPEEGPEGVYLWAAQKLYVRPDNVDYVRDRGGVLQIYWDDWELWDGLP